MNNKLREQLNMIGCYVICRENIGQDFGAWKDGIALIKRYNITDDLKWLLLCNDSNFCLGGKNSDDFIAKFSEPALCSKTTTCTPVGFVDFEPDAPCLLFDSII